MRDSFNARSFILVVFTNKTFDCSMVVVVRAGMKVNGGFFQQGWFCVRFFSPNSLIGMWQI